MKHLFTTLLIFTLLTSLFTLQAHAATVQLPKTGQTTSYAAGDDGDLEVGVAWPNPRFTDNGDQSVTDNLTGLISTKDANILNSIITYDSAGTLLGFSDGYASAKLAAGVMTVGEAIVSTSAPGALTPKVQQ